MTRTTLSGAALRLHVVTEWNKGDLSLTQIGAELGLPRGTIGRILVDAKARGMDVLKVGASVATSRRNAAWRANDPEGYHAFYVRFPPLGCAAHMAKVQARKAAASLHSHNNNEGLL